MTLDAGPTTSEDLTLTLDSGSGAGYDCVLLTTDLSTAATTDVYVEFNQRFAADDAIDIAYANTDTANITWTARIDSDPEE